MNIIPGYFENLDKEQIMKFKAMEGIYRSWNKKVNLISRKDFDNFYERHILHSLAIARVISFREGTRIMDAGSGGGFPGVPMAIMYPGAIFHLVDSTRKKMDAVEGIAGELGLQNLTTEHSRLEDHTGKYDFVTGRAVAALPKFNGWTGKNILPGGFNDMPNGTFYLKGEDVETEFIRKFAMYKVWDLSEFFGERFFETKRLVYFSGV